MVIIFLIHFFSPESAGILKFNRTKEVVWVKISCGWMVIAFYIWSLLYPNKLLPGRDFQNPLALETDSQVQLRMQANQKDEKCGLFCENGSKQYHTFAYLLKNVVFATRTAIFTISISVEKV